MVFSSIQFIFIFLPAVLLLYFLVPGKARNAVLFFASLFFYAWGEPVYVILLLLSAAFNYVMGIDIENRRNQPRLLKRSLVYGIAVNLLLLGFFKYYGFLIGTVNGISARRFPTGSLRFRSAFRSLPSVHWDILSILKEGRRRPRGIS